jgi:hypothetical protein
MQKLILLGLMLFLPTAIYAEEKTTAWHKLSPVSFASKYQCEKHLDYLFGAKGKSYQIEGSCSKLGWRNWALDASISGPKKGHMPMLIQREFDWLELSDCKKKSAFFSALSSRTVNISTSCYQHQLGRDLRVDVTITENS